jgi:hypothetical protein
MDSDPSLKNDPSIPDSEWLFRTIHPNWVKDANAVSSGAFKSKDPDTSVDLGSLTTPDETLARRPSHAGVVKLLTGRVRGIKPGVVGVAGDPVPGNPAHALIIRELTSSRVYSETARELAGLCEWVVGPRPPA